MPKVVDSFLTAIIPSLPILITPSTDGMIGCYIRSESIVDCKINSVSKFDAMLELYAYLVESEEYRP
jgi:hypothetical protein